MADTSSLHPRVQRFVMAFYALGIVMWLGGFIATVTHHDTLVWVFYGVLYFQTAMLTYGNINRSMRSRRHRKHERQDFFTYQAQLQLAMQQQIQQQILNEAMRKFELAKKKQQEETYRRAKVLLQQQQYQQQRWSIASDQYVDAIRKLKDLT